MDNKEVERKFLENKGLVYRIINHYKFYDCDWTELVDLSNFALYKAIITFNPDKGTQFSTYACTCIKNELFMYFRKNRKYREDTVSLDKVIGCDERGNEKTIADSLIDEKQDLENYICKKDDKRLLYELISELTEDEQYIILNRMNKVQQWKIGEELGNSSQGNISAREKRIKEKLGNKILEKFNIKDLTF